MSHPYLVKYYQVSSHDELALSLHEGISALIISLNLSKQSNSFT
jgi:hypothetical protein